MTRPIAGLLMTFACVLLPAGSQARQAASVESVRTELRALLGELNAAVAAHDRAALERIYADEFLFVHALGVPINKTQQIASAMAAPPGAALPIPSFESLMVFGDVAILRAPEKLRFGTSIYVRRNGRWQVLQLQGTPLPSTEPATTVAADILKNYVGRYQQDNGLFVTITFENGALWLQVDGRQKLALTPDSDTQFTLPAGAGGLTFARASDGVVSYVFRRGNGIITKGTRTAP